jgi:hypothetical protein
MVIFVGLDDAPGRKNIEKEISKTCAQGEIA